MTRNDGSSFSPSTASSSPCPCPGKLKDTLLDWEDDLPQLDWARAEYECHRADLILCLGTSLRIEPAGSLCTYPNNNHINSNKSKKEKEKEKKTKKKKTNTENKVDDDDHHHHHHHHHHHQLQPQPLGYVIVNLQPTPYDDGAALVIRAKVDDVMREVMKKLGYGEDWKEGLFESGGRRDE